MLKRWRGVLGACLAGLVAFAAAAQAPERVKQTDLSPAKVSTENASSEKTPTAKDGAKQPKAVDATPKKKPEPAPAEPAAATRTTSSRSDKPVAAFWIILPEN